MVAENSHNVRQSPTQKKVWKPMKLAANGEASSSTQSSSYGVPSMFAAVAATRLPLKIRKPVGYDVHTPNKNKQEKASPMRSTTTTTTTTSRPEKEGVVEESSARPAAARLAAATSKPYKKKTVTGTRLEVVASSAAQPRVDPCRAPVQAPTPKVTTTTPPRQNTTTASSSKKIPAPPSFPVPTTIEFRKQSSDKKHVKHWKISPKQIYDSPLLQVRLDDKPIATDAEEVLRVLRQAEEDAESVSSHSSSGYWPLENNTYHDKMQEKLDYFMESQHGADTSDYDDYDDVYYYDDDDDDTSSSSSTSTSSCSSDGISDLSDAQYS